MGRYEEAITSYDKALKYNPDYYYSWNNRGWALEHLDRYEEAIISYKRALQINPRFLDALNGLGWVLCELDRHEEAFAVYDIALEIDLNSSCTWNNRGWALGKLGRYKEAISAYDKALETDFTGDFASWFNRGWTLDKLQKYEEATFNYDKAFLSGIEKIGETQLLKIFFKFFSKLSEDEQELIDTVFSRELESLTKKQELEKQEIYARIRAFLLRITKIREDIPKEEWQKSHNDFAKNIDSYLM